MSEFDFGQIKNEFIDGMKQAASALETAAKETSSDLTRLKRFRDCGKDLFISGAITSHGGNLSESDGNSIWITRNGAMLSHLQSGDIVRAYLSPTDLDQYASMELVVHRAMYRAWADRMIEAKQAFVARAIAHAHTRHTVFRSLIEDAIKPVDSEGKLVLGNSVPVFSPANTIASEEVATLMADLVKSGYAIAVIRGHGPFVIADKLEHALRMISCLEYSSQLLCMLEASGKHS